MYIPRIGSEFLPTTVRVDYMSPRGVLCRQLFFDGVASGKVGDRMLKILKGHLIDTTSDSKFRIMENGYLVIEGGRIVGRFQDLPDIYANISVLDYGDRLLIPGLTDLHIHAPQFTFRSNGMDLELLDWLNTHTFPEESKYRDITYASLCYAHFVRELKESMTTRACIFATLHLHATLLLMQMLEDSGLITFVGKVNMDRNSPDYLVEESAKKSLEDTLLWLERCKGLNNTKPIVTPRFIPSCSDELMRGLADIAKKHRLGMQSHLSENPKEVEWVASLCPDSKFYLDAYEKRGHLSEEQKKSVIMAHCVYSGEREMQMLKDREVFVAHCPQSNTGLSSGIAPIRAFLNRGIRVGLGSDIAGGHSISMLRIAADAVDVSKLRWRLVDAKLKPLTVAESFALATRGGGAYFGKVGAFDAGFEADVVVLDDAAIRSVVARSLEDRIERAVYLSENCKVTTKYVRGVEIL